MQRLSSSKRRKLDLQNGKLNGKAFSLILALMLSLSITLNFNLVSTANLGERDNDSPSSSSAHKIGVKLKVSLQMINVTDGPGPYGGSKGTGNPDFTIQQNFFVECENGTIFWIQNVYHVKVRNSQVSVSQGAWIWSAPPGGSPTLVQHVSFATPAGSYTNVGKLPCQELELDSYISGSDLMMSGCQAGQASKVAELCPAKIIDEPANSKVRQVPAFQQSNTRPQHVLAGFGENSQANWGDFTWGWVESFDASSLDESGLPQWVQDNSVTVLTGHPPSDQTPTAETSHGLDWIWCPQLKRAYFGTKNCSKECGIAFCYAPTSRTISDFSQDMYTADGSPANGTDWQDITQVSTVRTLKTLKFNLTVNGEFPSMETFRDGAIMILIDIDDDGEVLPSRGIIEFYEGNLDYGIFIPSPEFGEPTIFIQDLQVPGAYHTEGATFSIEGNTIKIEVELNHIDIPNAVIGYVAAVRTGITDVAIEDRVPNEGLTLIGPEKILSDINEDLKVNIIDITIVAKAYNSEPGDLNWNPLADVQEPYYRIDILDITVIARDFGRAL